MVLCFLRKGSLQEATASPVLSDSGMKHLGELSGARIGLPILAYTPKTCPNYFLKQTLELAGPAVCHYPEQTTILKECKRHEQRHEGSHLFRVCEKQQNMSSERNRRLTVLSS